MPLGLHPFLYFQQGGDHVNIVQFRITVLIFQTFAVLLLPVGGNAAVDDGPSAQRRAYYQSRSRSI